jgi:hypothetical protein
MVMGMCLLDSFGAIVVAHLRVSVTVFAIF